MKSVDLEILLKNAIEAAKFAGDFAKENKHRRAEVAVMLDHDVKLQMDIETQKRAESFILARFPEHTIHGEEGQTESKANVYEWNIDPIDGTVNYTNDMRFAYFDCGPIEWRNFGGLRLCTRIKRVLLCIDRNASLL